VSKSSEFCSHNLCVASQRVFIVIITYFVIDSVRKLLDTPSSLAKYCTRGNVCILGVGTEVVEGWNFTCMYMCMSWKLILI
jgi:hypothetical protein